MNKKYFVKVVLSVCVLFFLQNCKNESESRTAEIKKETPSINMDVQRTDVYKDQLFPKWLASRKAAQVNKAKFYTVFKDFSFKDDLINSSIDFKHEITPDCAKYYKAAHYDHGTGVAIADVDNDGLYDIYFVSQIKAGELWKNLGNGKFKNITAQAGLDISNKKVFVSASFGDLDNDGDADLYITTVKDGNVLFENNGNGTFKDISVASNTNIKAHSSGSIFFDYNKDGLLDIFVTNVGKYTTDNISSFKNNGNDHSYYVAKEDAFYRHVKPEESEPSILFKNLGSNKFKNVNNEVGLNNSSWSGDAIFVDINEDGYDDIYLPNMQGADLYFENQKGIKFLEKSKSYFPKTSWGAMSVKAFDYNNDGKQDMYITDMHSDMIAPESNGYDEEKIKKTSPMPETFLLTKGQSIFGNSFFKKTGPNKFEEISDKLNLENYWPWGYSTGDINADGFEDLFIARSMNYPYRYQTNSLMLNNRGAGFLESEYILGVEPRRGGRYAQAWYDLDCDGADKGHKECKNRSGNLTIWGSLGTRSSAIFDLDNDGDLDMVTNEFNDVPMILKNNLSDTKKDLSYIIIKLEGTTSNRSAIGAKVVVKAGTSTYTKIMDGKLGYLSQSDYPLYFGLGEAKKVKEVSITWPNQKMTKTVLKDVDVNQVLKVKEE